MEMEDLNTLAVRSIKNYEDKLEETKEDKIKQVTY